MVEALIKFTQGANTDVAGKAVKGVAGDFSTVTVTNGDNTDVVSWTIYMLDAPAESATFPMGANPQILATANNNTPTVNFTPDVPYSYRLMLEVRNALGNIDRDIRCFGIPDVRGFIRPPYQKSPDPLPVALPIIISETPRPIKPDEQNYGSNERGWAGDGQSGQLEQFFEQYADLPPSVVSSTPFSATADEAIFYLVDLPTIAGNASFMLPLSPRIGYAVRLGVLGTPNTSRIVTVSAAGGGAIHSFSSITLLGEADLEFVHTGSNQWVARGAHHTTLERTIVGGTQTTDLTAWTVIGSAIVDLSEFRNINNTALWRAVAHTTDIADPVEIRLFNVTTAAVVAGSILTFSSLLPVQQQANITLASGSNIYEAQMRLSVTGSPNIAICNQAQFLMDVFDV